MSAALDAPPARNCAGCGTELAPKTYRGNPKKWCSESCRVWTYNHPGETRNRMCLRCGSALAEGRSKRCSLVCCQVGSGKRLAEPRRQKECGHAGCKKVARCRGLCKTHYNSTYHPGSQKDSRVDVARRRASWRNRNHRRRSTL